MDNLIFIKNKFQDIISKLIAAGIILITFVPLIRGYIFFSPFEFGKAVIFKIIVEILFALYLILIIINNDYLPWRLKKNEAVEYAILFFFAVQIIAAIFSVDPYLSFWGEPLRAGGIFVFAHYIILFFLALFFLDDKKWRRFWNLAIGVSVIISLIAIEQKLHFFNIPFLIYYERPASTIGNAGHLASYLLLFIFPTLSFAIQKLSDNKQRKNIFAAGLFFIAVAIQIFALTATAARGAFLGLITGTIAFLFLYPQKKYFLKITAIILIILMGASFYLPRMNFSGFLFAKDGIFQRLSAISPNEHTTQTRLIAWQTSLQAIKEKPLLGYGPENFSAGFDKFFSKKSAQWGPTETWFDRAHNFIFDIGVTSGLVGLSAYLGIFAAIFYKIFKKKKELLSTSSLSASKNQAIILTGIQSALIAYLTQNLFNFDTVSTYIISFLLLAYTTSLINKTETEKIKNINQIETNAVFKIIIAFITVFFIFKLMFFANITPFWVNSEINRLNFLTKKGFPEETFKQFKKLEKIKTPYDHYFYFLKQIPLKFAYAKMIKNTDPKKSEEITEEAIQQTKKYSALRPLYTRNYIFLIDLYDFLIQQGREEFQNKKDEALKKAKELSPNRF